MFIQNALADLPAWLHTLFSCARCSKSGFPTGLITGFLRVVKDCSERGGFDLAIELVSGLRGPTERLLSLLCNHFALKRLC